MLFEDERADRHVDVQVVRGLSRSIGALSVLAAAGLELGVKPEIDEGVLPAGGHDGDRPAVAAIAAVGTAAWDELLAAKTETAAPAVAGGHMDVHLIDEHQ